MEAANSATPPKLVGLTSAEAITLHAKCAIQGHVTCSSAVVEGATGPTAATDTCQPNTTQQSYWPGKQRQGIPSQISSSRFPYQETAPQCVQTGMQAREWRKAIQRKPGNAGHKTLR